VRRGSAAAEAPGEARDLREGRQDAPLQCPHVVARATTAKAERRRGVAVPCGGGARGLKSGGVSSGGGGGTHQAQHRSLFLGGGKAGVSVPA
jgi:hypothetical protein